MMTQATLITPVPYSNILYIGDEGKACLTVIEKFNKCLNQIELSYQDWFTVSPIDSNFPARLQHHIQYHFEGGIAMFKFRNADELPMQIRRECLKACSNLAASQSAYLS